MKKIRIEDIDNLHFWVNYFGCSYPNAYDEEEDVSVSDLMQEINMEGHSTEESRSWWDEFTGYYDGVLDESDGYVDEPATLEVMLPHGKGLKIEFHPGDTLYYINEEKIGSTGPHWELQTVPYEEIRRLLTLRQGCQLYLLLLPLAVVKQEEAASARKEIAAQMRKYFPESLCESVSGCIVSGCIIAGLAESGS